MAKKTYTPEEYKAKIEKKKAYNLCKLDTFPAIKIGNTYSIPKRLYLKWLGENVGKKVYL